MSDTPTPDDPNAGSGDPFGPFGIPGFDPTSMNLADLMRFLQSEGPVNWEIAHQTAGYVALDGEHDAAPEPDEVAALEELARTAAGVVAAETGITEVLSAPVRVVGRADWARIQLDALKPVLEALAVSLRGSLDDVAPDPSELPPELAGPFAALGLGGDGFGGIMGMVAPMLLGTQAGSMVGYLAQHALGRYDLPLPTTDVAGPTFVLTNLRTFEEEWSIEPRDLRFAVALHEAVQTAVRSRPWVQAALSRLAIEFVSGYDLDVSRLEDRFGEIDPSDPASLAGAAERPEEILGAMRSPRQDDAARRLESLVIAIVGYADAVLAHIATPLLPDFGRIHEAIVRQHVDQGEAGRFVEGLLGIRLDRDAVATGRAFTDGVAERAGAAGLHRLWESERMLPTPNELAAPGLWLARIDLPED
ncbi:MAG: zinc-dependent metalloprotease [Actinomycetes bacterium]